MDKGKFPAKGSSTGMFEEMIDARRDFFETGNVPVPKEETLEIMALIEAGARALEQDDTWIEVGR